MIVKIVIGLLLLLILYCLGSALYYLLSAQKSPKNMARALTWRISLSVGVFVLLLVAFAAGWIHPHGV